MLKELDKDLHELGQGLVIKVGSAIDVFNDIIKQMQKRFSLRRKQETT